MQLLFDVMLDMSATYRLDEIGPSIEPCDAPYLDVRRDKQFESMLSMRQVIKNPMQKYRRKV